MHTCRPYCLSIAGFDPCGGAGILADIKTFEQLGVYGLGVCTAVTYQNDTRFEGLHWLEADEIRRQLEALAVYDVQVVKIGIVENIERLEAIVNWVEGLFAGCRIIWDPILKASAGFSFHSALKLDIRLLKRLYLITPNREEYELLGLDRFRELPVLLKGGHREEKGVDTLFTLGKAKDIPGKPFSETDSKHGTGCVLSAAIAANLAQGSKLLAACKQAKHYVESFMKSNPLNLGYHA